MSITWGELRKYIDTQCETFLHEEVKIFDFHDGEEHSAGVTELLLGEENDNDGWVPYLTINEDEAQNDT